MIARFLSANWLYLAIAVVVLFLTMRIDALKTENAVTEARLETQTVLVADLRRTLTVQNAAVSRLSDAAVANREVYVAGLNAANRTAVRLEVKAEDILNTSPPSDPADRCEAARGLLIGASQ